MHARRRSPGDGVRSNSVGIGLASGRISPEASIRGRGMYNSEYRNFNRGFGRAPPKPYPPLPQPPRRGDIFMEAGRLAAEYLVSQGLLPPNALQGKWQNGNLKGQMGDFQEFRVQDRENLALSSEGRSLDFARVGNAVPEGVSGRRRFPDDFNSMGHRNPMRGRKRTGPFRGFRSDWGRENGRKGPWSEKTRVFPDTVEGGDDFLGESYQGERQFGSGVGGRTSKVITDGLPSKGEIAGDSESELETYEFTDDAGTKASSSSTKKDLPPETDAGLSKGLDDANVLNWETKEVNEGTVGDKMEKEIAREDFEKQYCSAEKEPISKHGGDLLRLCSFAKVPTKARSSLASRMSGVDQGPSTEERNTCDIAPVNGSKVPMEEDSVEASTHSSKSLTSDISIVPSVQFMDEAVDLDATFVAERERCTRSQSFSDGSSFMHQQESNDGPPGFVRCKSMDLSNDGDSLVHDVSTWETNKRPRESPSSGVSQADEDLDEDLLLHNLRAKQSCSEVDRLSPDDKMVESVDQKILVEGDSVPKSGAESDMEVREEKQLLPSSFKICDLNLMDVSEIAESPNDLIQDHVSTAHSPPEIEKEAPMDVVLSISNNLGGFDDYHGLTSDSKDVTVVDVPNGSLIEDKGFDTSGQKTEVMYSSLESFLNHTENTVDLPDVQDGYGHAISEFLGTDISNCSSVPADIHDLQTQISLHGQEGIPGDDDSIYLSLGEIPISFLGVWDQPTQDYGKPF